MITLSLLSNTAVPETVQVTTNLIINAISRKLKETYGKDTRVFATRQRQGFKAPCFFIETGRQRERRISFRRFERTMTFTLHYFPENIVDTNTAYFNKEPTDPHGQVDQHVYDVGDQLYKLLDTIQISDKVFNGNTINVHARDKEYIVIDNVLHFNFTISYHSLLVIIAPYMEELVQNNTTRTHRRSVSKANDQPKSHQKRKGVDKMSKTKTAPQIETQEKETQEKQPTNLTKYTKEKLVKSVTFKKHRDLVDALLEDDKTYTKEEVWAMVEAFENEPTYETDNQTEADKKQESEAN